MKLIQCDRCGETEGEPLAAQYSTPQFHHKAKIYRADMYGNYQVLDLCTKCQDLGNEVVARFMVATLKEETSGRENERENGSLGQAP